MRPLKRARGAARRAFTLVEALIASAVLSVTVLAIGSAIGAAQMSSHEGQKAVLGAMVCGDYLSELMTLPYEDIEARSGEIIEFGEITTLDGAAYPEAYWPLGRAMTATEEVMNVAEMGVQIRGLRIEVMAFDERRVVARAETFLPEPAE
jgi:competence protein ComGC